MLMSDFILYFDSHVFVFHYYCFSVFKKFQFKLQLRLLVCHHFNHFDFDFLKKIMIYILINKYIMTGFVWNILVFRQFYYFYYNFLYTGLLGILDTVSFFFLVIEELGYRNSGIRVRARGVRGILINADEKSKKTIWTSRVFFEYHTRRITRSQPEIGNPRNSATQATITIIIIIIYIIIKPRRRSTRAVAAVTVD